MKMPTQLVLLLKSLYKGVRQSGQKLKGHGEQAIITSRQFLKLRLVNEAAVWQGRCLELPTILSLWSTTFYGCWICMEILFKQKI